MLAAGLRLANLGQSPPGLNQDEAANAWNAWCLLETGNDQAGKSWPIFYTRALGSNFTTLNIYLLIPFQAVGGLNAITTRLPAALGGILAVFLIYWVGKRLFGVSAGLLAAALLAIDPWHLLTSRWGHEANLCPLLAIVPLAMLLLARLPIGQADTRPPRVALAGLAGVLTGVCCYGYPAIRIFLPLFVTAVIAVNGRAWWQLLKTRRGGLAVAAFALGGLVTFGPLVWQHLASPQDISRRTQGIWLWTEQDSASQRFQKVLARYAGHFGPDFLFLDGDGWKMQAPPDMGQLPWYMLPIMVLGLAHVLGSARRCGAARLVLVWLLLYPVGDCLFAHAGDNGQASLHALRSSPGICGLVLLAAVGARQTGAWLARKGRKALWAAGAVLAAAVAAGTVPYLVTFFGEYNRRPIIYHRYHVDLVEACQWLRPRLDQVQAVFVTVQGDQPGRGIIPFNQPYVTMLVSLGYDPHQWFADPARFIAMGWDMYYRVGKLNFMYGMPETPVAPQAVPAGTKGRAVWQKALEEIGQSGQPGQVAFLLRPWEVDPRRGFTPSHVIVRPDGVSVLGIYVQAIR